ncbi:MAG TPA: adenylate/guanylate cyclase domain-containing protein [Gaiellaceae bacterium]|nr:adenylate/guanylate cyclase domain-containing protein [Gaiellaceae bacterium]
MAGISQQEIAELAPCSLDYVQRLIELGILGTLDDDGLLPSTDVHVVRLMTAFEEAGISLDDVARGLAAGDLSFPLGTFLPEPERHWVTYEDLGARLGRSPALLRRLSGEFGLPPPADDRVRDEDARMLSLLSARLDLATDAELSRFARLYGGTIQRLVESGLQFFDRAVRQRVGTFDVPDEEKDRLVYERAAGFTELVSTVVPWLQRRHREHSVLQYLVGVTEGFMEERGIVPSQPKQPPAIAFLDLTGYTALAEERGDEAAAELAADLATIVQEAAQAHRGRTVKWLGDGVMFHFAEPGRAILGGLEIVEETERAISISARVGINAGAVVAQEGDYFGRTVNIAARIADYARPREVLVSEEAKQSAGLDEVDFELIGDVPLKGVSRSVRLHKAVRPAT